MTEVICCANCGLERTRWAQEQGYTDGSATYCCKGCAEGDGCTCGQEEGLSEAG